MTDADIIEHLKSGQTVSFGCHGRNAEIMELMAGLERDGLIETEDEGLSQETRRVAKWVGDQPGCVHCDGAFRAKIEGERLCQNHAEAGRKLAGMIQKEGG